MKRCQSCRVILANEQNDECDPCYYDLPAEDHIDVATADVWEECTTVDRMALFSDLMKNGRMGGNTNG